MDSKKGLLIIISGPSGVGKGTIRKELMKDLSLNLVYSVSLTTRSKREGEVDGVDYIFVSHEEFNKYIEEDKLLEWAEFVHNKYGTPKDEVEKLRNQGKNVILEIEVNGATQVFSKLQNDDRMLSIFLVPPSLEELENRIRLRSTESDEIIKKRLNKAKSEMKLKDSYDNVVVNDDPYEAAMRVAKIIKDKI